MAEFYGTNADYIVDGKKVPPGDGNGHTKNMSDSFLGAQAVYAIGDVIYMGAKIPKGAKVKHLSVKSESLGTTGIFEVGYAATEDSAEDSDALGTGYDAGGQAVATQTVVLADKLTESKQVQIKFTEATQAASAKTIKVNVEYVVD